VLRVEEIKELVSGLILVRWGENLQYSELFKCDYMPGDETLAAKAAKAYIIGKTEVESGYAIPEEWKWLAEVFDSNTLTSVTV
jgi:hypothetical protein